MLELRVLGPLEIVEMGRARSIGSTRQRDLLALLIVHANEPVSTDRIIDELWGDGHPDGGARAVAFHVARLRDALAPDRRKDGESPIATEAGGYALRIDPERIDAVRFERLAAEGRALVADDPATASERLNEGLSLWRGEPFADLADLVFLQPEIARLHELRLRTLEDRFEADLVLGRGRDIVGELEGLVTAEPLREHLRSQLMRALYVAGRQADALRVYQEGRRQLADELGIDPSPELQALELAILRQDPTLDRARVGIGPRNPYKGLRPFDEADAADFFGREALAARLLDRLEAVSRAGGLLLVVGPSGSGKSSVIGAGLLPRLRARAAARGGSWRVATMLPGSRPEEALLRAVGAVVPDSGVLPVEPPGDADAIAALLTRAAAADPRNLVLVVDQLEELFALPADPEAAARFLGGLAGALTGPAPRPVVVAALRADRFDRPLLSADVGRLIRDGTEVVTPMSRDELERAIVRPAEAVGVELEPGLAAELEADVIDRPGALPLLQFALTELFERSAGRRLTRESYAAIGGVAGAIGRRAEAVFTELDPQSRDLARQVFLRLVAVGDGRAPVARRMAVDELRSIGPTPDHVDAVLDAFGRSRLLAFDRDPRSGLATVEPAHEALLTHWARLAGWIGEAEQSLWIEARLRDAAGEWAAAGREPDYLLSGSRLDVFASWAATTDLRLDGLERDLLDASLAEQRRSEAIEQARAALQRSLERREARWLRSLVAVFAVAAVVSTALLALVWRQSEAASEERAVATARELAVASGGRLGADPGLALLLAVESARATADRGWITEEALDALHVAIQAARIPYPTEVVPVAVRAGPSGGFGIYLLPVADLIRLAMSGAARTLTPEECLTYLHVEVCPASAPSPPGDGPDVMTADGPVPMDALAATTGTGASVRMWSQLPVDPGGLLADLAGEGVTITITSDATGADPITAIGRADVAILARPGDVADLARAGLLLDVRGILRPDETAAVAEAPQADLGWVGERELGATAKGARLVGVPIAATAASLLWYPKEAFEAAGYEPPRTWAELDDLVAQMIADGRVPWCMGLAGGEQDGAAGVDWLEDLVIDISIPGSSLVSRSGYPIFGRPSVATAYLRFHDLIAARGAVLGGPGSAVRTPSEWTASQMGTAAEPRCWLIHAGAVEQTRWTGPVRPDLTPIRLPIGEEPAAAMRSRVYTLVVLADRPEVRALVRYILGPQFAAALASDDPAVGILPLGPSGEPALAASPESAIRTWLAAAMEAGGFSADATDRMSRGLGTSELPASVLRVAEADSRSAGSLIADELERLGRVP